MEFKVGQVFLLKDFGHEVNYVITILDDNYYCIQKLYSPTKFKDYRWKLNLWITEFGVQVKPLNKCQALAYTF